MQAKGRNTVCKFCEGYYDFGSDQSVCSSCHAFVYEFSSPYMTEDYMLDEKEASNDSGNEDSDKLIELSTGPINWPQLNVSRKSRFFYNQRNPYSRKPTTITTTTGGMVDGDNVTTNQNDNNINLDTNTAVTYTYTSQSRNLSTHHHQYCGSSTSMTLEDLPTEILSRIFCMLDDICLWNLRQVSARFLVIIDNEITEQQWEEFVKFRWPLFSPHCRVDSWKQLYFNLMDSVTCRFCLERLRLPILFPIETPKLRYRRIKCELKNLCTDPPYGIRIIPLDTETYSHCLAGIEGPPQSPYQGGFFHVLILVPDSYPIRPPVIRFLTRILHPNISFHGDVGMDCIRHNWSLALTLEKLLISVQSLLTDPYTKICMEPILGTLYEVDKYRFEELAKLWTWKFACHDYLSANFVSSMILPDYIEQLHKQIKNNSHQ